MAQSDWEHRVEALEHGQARLHTRLDVVETESRAARTLAAAADRDVSNVRAELHGHTRVLDALRETQLEQGATLREHGEALIRLENRMDRGFDTVDRRFETLHTGMVEITTLLRRLETQSDPEDPEGEHTLGDPTPAV
jgi:hypothetical protein